MQCWQCCHLKVSLRVKVRADYQLSLTGNANPAEKDTTQNWRVGVIPGQVSVG